MNCQKVLITLIIIACGLETAAEAQQKPKRTEPNTYYRAPHSMAGKMIVLPIGTTFEGRLTKTLSSAKSHAGESFALVLSSPVLANGIDVVIPAGAQVIGEVVEAISSHAQPRKKHMPPPRGKLRIQINQLRTPDGTSFPLVANLIGEEEGRRGGSQFQTPLGSSVGFVGTSEAFEAVAPGSNRYGKTYASQQGRGPEKDYVHKRQFLADEIYGTGGERYSPEDRRIRALVLRKYDLYVDEGSPMTVRLSAPLRLSVSPFNSGAPVGGSQDMGAPDDSLPAPSLKGGGADIPPITGSGGEAATPPAERKRARSSAPVEAAPPPPATSGQATQQPAVPPASPSSEF
jgi:hypothetical protein